MAPKIAFEGISGCGKTTIISLLRENLYASGYRVEIADTETTGDAPALHCVAKKYPFSHPVRLFLLWALRLMQYEYAEAAATRADVVLLDRSFATTLAYDICGNGLPPRIIAWVGSFLTAKPDRTILLDMPTETAAGRKKSKTGGNPEFACKAAAALRGFAAGDPSWVTVNAEDSLERVGASCLAAITPLLENRGGKQ